MSFIDIKNLNFSYCVGNINVPIFFNFNLKVNKGDFIAIKGPSGSGKSTLLYLIAGLLKYHSGEVLVDNKDIFKLSDFELSQLRNKEMGFVFQQFHLLSKTSVLDNILLPSLYPIECNKNKSAKEFLSQAKEIATFLGIEHQLNRHPNQLSGGQQQRVAIARALINDANIILADEPTGNLDSKSTKQIISILKKLNNDGKTIILITHEDEVADAASTIYHLNDGQIRASDKQQMKLNNDTDILNVSNLEERSKQIKINFTNKKSILNYCKIFPLVIKNILKHKMRSFLTMLGITVGIAAVCSMITLGNFTKKKILNSYATLGVNTIIFRGYPSWNLKATDVYPLKYNSFKWKKELLPLKKIFPDIVLMSPVLHSWAKSITYGGKSVDNDPKVIGLSEDGLNILRRKLLSGRNITKYHIERKSSVCLIGFTIAKKLFYNTPPLGNVIQIIQRESSFSCRVIGVLKSKTSSSDWNNPDKQIYLPFTTFQALTGSWWSARITKVSIRLKKNSDIVKIGKGIRNFFEVKYGKSGRFRVNSNSVLIAQMSKFLSLFSILLVGIAIVSLIVGGMGITNMMLVSVSERLKEIGIRKSIGATNISIRYQFLFESITLCLIAGFFGLIIGVIGYQSAIYGASVLIKKLKFEWVFDPLAISLSIGFILFVGIVSGLVPALKAEKLQVIDALRNE